MRKFILGAGAAVAMALSLLPAGAVSAQAADISYYTPENISAILKELGATDITVSTSQSGTKFIKHKFEGFTYAFSLHLCPEGKPGCLGMALVASFAPEPNQTFELTTVNSFNASRVFAQAHVADRNIYLMRYIICDGGVSDVNVKSNIQNFWGMPAQLVAHFQSSIISQAPSVVQPVVYGRAPQPVAPFVQQIGADVLQAIPANRLRR